MTATIFDQWTKMSKLTTEPMMEYGALCAKYWSELAKQNLEAGSNLVQAQSDQLGALAQIKTPEEFYNQQTKFALAQTPKTFEYTERALETLQESVKETSKLTQKYAAQFSKDQYTKDNNSKTPQK